MAYLGSIVRSDFDGREIARLTLGPDYTKLEPFQKQIFQELLTQYTAASFTRHFNNGKAAKRIAGVQSLSPTTAAVLTRLQTEGGKRHTLDYVLMRDPNHSWQIVNVVADGVSDLSLKRDKYAAEFAKGGFPRLVTKMRAEITHLAG
ncbi:MULTISPECIES: ABC transporter substrate-binding protein [Acidithiobacillus]|uniref:ABC transporter substrate-binding protein n=1 Tax=Acidithiobacillus TaxID=119977 RepID=UPI0021F84451|nr:MULTISPECIES: ABC transporter substrate-binding protein [Acidithiobacillus]